MLEEYCLQIGIPKDQINNEDIIDFISKFITEHGGITEVKAEFEIYQEARKLNNILINAVVFLL